MRVEAWYNLNRIWKQVRKDSVDKSGVYYGKRDKPASESKVPCDSKCTQYMKLSN